MYIYLYLSVSVLLVSMNHGGLANVIIHVCLSSLPKSFVLVCGKRIRNDNIRKGKETTIHEHQLHGKTLRIMMNTSGG